MFFNRETAGKKLARMVQSRHGDSTLVLALPRGGVVLGAEVAKALSVPLGVLFVRKLGHPDAQEFAAGAIAEGENALYDSDESTKSGWHKTAEQEAKELLKKRHDYYYEHIPLPSVAGQTVVVVDDGMATGMTMKVAILALKKKNPRKIIIAAPVASEESVAALRPLVDDCIVLQDPGDFQGAVGAHYMNFPQVEDEEVRAILEKANGARR